jgi:cell division protein ZapA (FtsZ GTPase activity inhibitor)
MRMTTSDEPANLNLVASLLDAYLQRPDLPARVELCCLSAAIELQRAGAIAAPLPAADQVKLADVIEALQSLPADIFETDPVLNAVAQLTTAASALGKP